MGIDVSKSYNPTSDVGIDYNEDMQDNSIKISITGKLTYSDEISISQATQIIAFLNSDEPKPGELGAPPREGGITSRNPKAKQIENARDAIDTCGAKTNPEKIVALGAYVLQDGGETFKVEDVKSQFRRARETVPGNFTRDLNAAISAGWIAEDDNVTGEYYLTSKVDGIFNGAFVFPKASSGGGGRQRSGKRGGAKVKAIQPETLSDIGEFQSTMDGYLPYSKMKTEKDRLLWVATYMRDKHGRKTVSNKEIVWVSDHIGAGIPSGHVASAFNSAKASGHVVRSTLDNSIRVTDKGAQYLASLTTEA